MRVTSLYKTTFYLNYMCFKTTCNTTFKIGMLCLKAMVIPKTGKPLGMPNSSASSDFFFSQNYTIVIVALASIQLVVINNFLVKPVQFHCVIPKHLQLKKTKEECRVPIPYLIVVRNLVPISIMQINSIKVCTIE